MKIQTTRHTLNGKRVNAGTPGAIVTNTKSKNWWAVWKENGRVVDRVPLCSDKRAARAMMTDKDRQRQHGEMGLTDPHKDDKARPIAEHIADYLNNLTVKKRDDEYIRKTYNTLTKVTLTCGFKCIADFKSIKLEKFIDEQSCGSNRKNDYRSTLIALCNWLVSKDRMASNPFKNIVPVEHIAVRERRSLSLAELRKLLDTVRERPLIVASQRAAMKGKSLSLEIVAQKTMRGWERWLTYKTACLTGLRRGELKQLLVSDVFLGEQPELTLDGKFTKNKQIAKLPLRTDHADELRHWITETGKKPTDAIFRIPQGKSAMVDLRLDLEAAEIAFKIGNKVFDWHCFRVQFTTLLSLAKVYDRDKLLLTRHADRHLTDHYDDDNAHFPAMRLAVESLPSLTYLTAEEKERQLAAQERQQIQSDRRLERQEKQWEEAEWTDDDERF